MVMVQSLWKASIMTGSNGRYKQLVAVISYCWLKRILRWGWAFLVGPLDKWALICGGLGFLIVKNRSPLMTSKKGVSNLFWLEIQCCVKSRKHNLNKTKRDYVNFYFKHEKLGIQRYSHRAYIQIIKYFIFS